MQARGQSWFDLKLMVKLAFLVVILCQSSTMSHTIFMGGIAVVVYLQQVGIIRYILQAVGAVRPDQAQVGNAPQAGGGGAGPNAVGGAANNAAALVAQAPDLPRGNIPHATTGGIVTDILTFFTSLFLSLVPSWTPTAMEPVHQPLEGDEFAPQQLQPPQPALVQ